MFKKLTQKAQIYAENNFRYFFYFCVTFKTIGSACKKFDNSFVVISIEKAPPFGEAFLVLHRTSIKCFDFERVGNFTASNFVLSSRMFN